MTHPIWITKVRRIGSSGVGYRSRGTRGPRTHPANNYFAAPSLAPSSSFPRPASDRALSFTHKHSPFSRSFSSFLPSGQNVYPAVRRPPTRCKTNGLVTAATLRFKTGLIVGFPDEKRPRYMLRIEDRRIPAPSWRCAAAHCFFCNRRATSSECVPYERCDRAVQFLAIERLDRRK